MVSAWKVWEGISNMNEKVEVQWFQLNKMSAHVHNVHKDWSKQNDHKTNLDLILLAFSRNLLQVQVLIGSQWVVWTLCDILAKVIALFHFLIYYFFTTLNWNPL